MDNPFNIFLSKTYEPLLPRQRFREAVNFGILYRHEDNIKDTSNLFRRLFRQRKMPIWENFAYESFPSSLITLFSPQAKRASTSVLLEARRAGLPPPPPPLSPRYSVLATLFPSVLITYCRSSNSALIFMNSNQVIMICLLLH